MTDEESDGLDTLLLTEFITAILLESLLVVIIAQTILQVSAKLFGDFLKCQCMGRLRHGLVGLPRLVIVHGLLVAVLLAHLCGFDLKLPSGVVVIGLWDWLLLRILIGECSLSTQLARALEGST